MTDDLLFIDLETVTLTAGYGSIWEIAWARLDGPIEHVQVVPDLRIADPDSLAVGQFGARYDHAAAIPQSEAAIRMRDLLDVRGPTVLAGSAPWFDAAHLAALLDVADPNDGPWHHHHVDVPALAGGALGVDPPHSLKEVAAAAGLDLDRYDRHTAAGDVALTRDLYRWWQQAMQIRSGLRRIVDLFRGRAA